MISDRFFREMLHACGTQYVTRWVMWSAVALRTRWKAGAWKRAKVLLWALSSIIGISGTIGLLAAVNVFVALMFGAAMLAVAALLWGRQWGAAVFAAIALPWIAPAAVLVLIATLAFRTLDRALRRYDKPIPPPPLSA